MICVVVVRLTVSEVMVWAFSSRVESLSFPMVSADCERDTFSMLDDAELESCSYDNEVQSVHSDDAGTLWDTDYRYDLPCMP